MIQETMSLLPTHQLVHKEGSNEDRAYLSVQIERKEFPRNGSSICVLENLNFDVGRGQFVSLLGPSGCGKTTLLRLIAGLDTSYAGRIRLGADMLRGPGPDRGLVFQESRLLPWFTVERNVAFALPRTTGHRDKVQRVNYALELVGLSECRNAWPYQLSGGMEKRVAFARALVNVPNLLLMDEPFSALDAFAKFDIQDKVAQIHEREQITTVLVTHDVDEAVYLSDWVALLTPSPATIRALYQIALPRPRRRASPDFEKARMTILQKVLDQSQ